MDITPYTVSEGKVTAIKIGEEVIETPSIPVENLNRISEAAQEYLDAKKEFEASRQSFVLIETRFLNKKEQLETAMREAGTTNVEKRIINRSVEPVKPEVKEAEVPPEKKEGDVKERVVEASLEQALLAEKELAAQVVVKEVSQVLPEKPAIASEEHVSPPKPPEELGREIYPEVIKAFKEKGKFNEAELHVQLASMGVPEEQVKLIGEMIINELMESKAAYKKYRFFIFKKEKEAK